MYIVTSNDPINMSFPNKFQLGNPENDQGKLEIHFNDLHVETLQRKWSRSRMAQTGKERRWNIKRLSPAMVRLIRKQGSSHKKVMKLLKEMIELHNHVFELQMLANELSTLKLQSSVIHF